MHSKQHHLKAGTKTVVARGREGGRASSMVRKFNVAPVAAAERGRPFHFRSINSRYVVIINECDGTGHGTGCVNRELLEFRRYK